MRTPTTRRARSGERGFTLIELLVVIVILGVVAAIVVFSVGAVTDKGLKSACKTNLKDIQVASEAHYAKFATYTDVEGLVTAGFIRDAPDTDDYTITVDTVTGEVTASGNNCNSL